MAGFRESLPVTDTADLQIVLPYVGPTAGGSDRETGRQLPIVALATPDLLRVLELDRALEGHEAGRTLLLVDEGASAVDVPSVLAPKGVEGVMVGQRPRDVPAILVAPDAFFDGVDAARRVSRLVVRLDRAVTSDDLELATDIADLYGLRVQGAHPEPSLDADRIRSLSIGSAGLISLIIAIVGLALLSTETRVTERVLLELGADPRSRRTLATLRAVLLTGLAGLFAVPIGTLPLWAVARGAPRTTLANGSTLQWTGMVVTLLIAPAGAALVSRWTTRASSSASHRRRLDPFLGCRENLPQTTTQSPTTYFEIPATRSAVRDSSAPWRRSRASGARKGVAMQQHDGHRLRHVVEPDDGVGGISESSSAQTSSRAAR